MCATGGLDIFFVIYHVYIELMLKDVIEVSLLHEKQNDRVKNIISVFYGIQCSLNNFELSATIMTNSSPDHNTSASEWHITFFLCSATYCSVSPVF
jgi:hypothetical protein